MSTTRRRNNNLVYNISINTPEGPIEEFEYINNLQEIANILNNNYFSGFEIITRTMVSNWIHYPDKPRREYANAFTINKSKL